MVAGIVKLLVVSSYISQPFEGQLSIISLLHDESDMIHFEKESSPLLIASQIPASPSHDNFVWNLVIRFINSKYMLDYKINMSMYICTFLFITNNEYNGLLS